MSSSFNVTSVGTQNSYSARAQIQGFYVRKVKGVVLFLRQKQCGYLANLVATLLIEPLNTLYLAYLMKRGLDGKKFANLNPIVLSSAQKRYSPVLLIHGDSTNSGIFDSMIKQLSKDAPDRPIFTVDLISPDGIVSEGNHLNALVAKVQAIAALYPTCMHFKMAFVGFSSGGDILGPLTKVLQERQTPFAGTLIKIGSIFERNEIREFLRYFQGNALEIVGTRDVFEGSDSYLRNKLVVASGHLGLLFNRIVLERVSRETQIAI